MADPVTEFTNPETGEVVDFSETFVPKPATFRHVNGREVLDATPIEPPIGFKRQKSLAEQIREMVRSENLRQLAEASGHESFEDADDFDVEDMDPSSPYEGDFDNPNPEPLPTPLEAAIRAAGGSAGGKKAQPKGPPPAPRPPLDEPPSEAP